MGEKETASAGNATTKQAPDTKKDEEQAYVQDNSPNSESTARQGDTAKNAIQNMR